MRRASKSRSLATTPNKLQTHSARPPREVAGGANRVGDYLEIIWRLSWSVIGDILEIIWRLFGYYLEFGQGHPDLLNRRLGMCFGV